MELNKHSSSKRNTEKLVENKASETLSPRKQYLLEKERIISEIGGLEDIRMKLGLSQRKLCKLLLVDPSAWTRWNKTDAPPHIYQALKWLIDLTKLDPEAAAPTNITNRVDLIQASTNAKISKIESKLETVERFMSTPNPSTLEIRTIKDPHIESAILSMEERFQLEVAKMKSIIEELRNQKVASSKRKKSKIVKKKVKSVTKKKKRKPAKKTKRKSLKPNGVRRKKASSKKRITKIKKKK